MLEAFEQISDAGIVALLTHEEHVEIDRNLFLRKVNQAQFLNEADIDIVFLLEGCKLDLTGREARKMLNGSFSVTLQHMNLVVLQAQLQNREKLNKLTR